MHGRRLRFRANPLIFAVIYCLSLILFVRSLDYWVPRTFFNLFVMCISAAALQIIQIRYHHLKLMLGVAVVVLFIAVIRDVGSGKLQVHQQLFTLYAVTIIAAQYQKDYKLAGLPLRSAAVHGGMLLLSILLSVRSVSLVSMARFAVRPHYGFIRVVLAILAIFIGIVYFVQLLSQYDSVGSLLWRVNHWSTILDNFNQGPQWFGNGIGAVWRNFTYLLELEWYLFDSYVDSHNIYIHVLYDTGIVGLLMYIALLCRLYWQSGNCARELIILFCVYGLFQGGPWNLHLPLIFVLAGFLRPEREAKQIAAGQRYRTTRNEAVALETTSVT
jgi:hypothetical protein